MAHHLCPNCGHNLTAERPLRAGRFAYDPGLGVLFDNERMRLSPLRHQLVGMAMHGRGGVVTMDAIAFRLYYDCTTITNRISVDLHHIRKAFEALGVDLPIKRVHGAGLAWIGPPVERVDDARHGA